MCLYGYKIVIFGLKASLLKLFLYEDFYILNPHYCQQEIGENANITVLM